MDAPPRGEPSPRGGGGVPALPHRFLALPLSAPPRPVKKIASPPIPGSNPRKYLQGINNLCKGEIAKINLNSAVTPSLSGMAAFFQLLGVGLDQLFFANLLLPSFFQPAEVSLATDLVTQ